MPKGTGVKVCCCRKRRIIFPSPHSLVQLLGNLTELGRGFLLLAMRVGLPSCGQQQQNRSGTTYLVHDAAPLVFPERQTVRAESGTRGEVGTRPHLTQRPVGPRVLSLIRPVARIWETATERNVLESVVAQRTHYRAVRLALTGFLVAILFFRIEKF